MNMIVKKALGLLVGDDSQTDLFKVPKKSSKNRPLKTLSERELMKLESAIGAKIFGTPPKGHRRQFFNLDERTWIWYDEWKEGGKDMSTTIRYELHDKGVFKVQEGARYSYIEGEELEHFTLAVRMYYEQVMRKIYKIDPATGEKLL